MSCSFAMSTHGHWKRCGKRWRFSHGSLQSTGRHIFSRLPGDFRSWVLTRLMVENCQCDKLLEVFRETKDTKSLTSAHTKGPFNNPFLSFPFPSSCHKAEAQANERREVPEQKNPGRDGRPGLTYGFSYIRERWKELAISAKTAENRDNLEVGRCDVKPETCMDMLCVYVCMLMIFLSQWGGSDM